MGDEKKEGFDPSSMGKDVFSFMKSSFDTAFDNMVKIQDLNEKMFKDTIGKGKEAQTDGVKMVNDFVENAKKGRDEYRKLVEDGFKKMEDMFKGEKKK